jgi:uncharacterized protein (DUF1501 family)
MTSRPSSRRRFIGQASCAAVSSIPVLSSLLNLSVTGKLAAAEAEGGYRALVCVFLSGGNDSFNMLAPYAGDPYAEYMASRADLALPASQLIPITPDNTPGRTFGVHHRLPNLAARFAAGQAAFVANVGTLIEPVQNRSQVALNLKRLPLGLYSHSDQIEQWQTSVPHARSGIGWAGRTADLIKQLNADPRVSMNVSFDGSNVWQTGHTVAEYAVNAGNSQEPVGGAIALTPYRQTWQPNQPLPQAASAAVDSQLALEYTNLLQQTFVQKRRAARDAFALYDEATRPALPGTVTFPNTPLGRQMQMVARTINGRSALGACRQTFFVNRGGWDHHNEVRASQDAMLPEVDDAIGALWNAVVAMGVQDQVVIYSASDFGRTLTSNARGSDHAWGGNQFVLGGAVAGRKIYGQYPSLAVNPESGSEVNPLDTGRGRFIPTTSVDAFFAEMALWLGVPPGSLPLVLPNIGNFYTPNAGSPPLGFLMA